jgi:hypothetical protein
MQELIEISFSPVNAFFSIMSIVMLLYWLTVIIAGLDPDLFSIDFDAADLETNFDNNSQDVPDRTGNADGNGFLKILQFFSFDELPLMFILTIIFITMWFLGINISYYLGIESTWVGVILLIPNLIFSLFIVKLLSKPLSYLYKQVNHKGEPEIDFLGRRCVVFSALDAIKTGQIQLSVNGDPMRLSARSNTEEKLAAGQEAVIVAESEDKRYYLVEKFDY